MMDEKDRAVVYDILLSAPGMEALVSVGFKLPRKAVLLLSQVIEKGLEASRQEKGSVWAAAFGQEHFELLDQVKAEMLEKASLTSMKEKLSRVG